MPRTDISRLSDDANVWIFPITPPLGDAEAMLGRVDAFLDAWAAHNVPVLAARELRENRFLIVAADKDAEKSGCSIDRLFALVRTMERDLGVSMLDAGVVYYRDAEGAVRDAKRSELGDRADESTIVFDTTAPTLGDIRRGTWERPARDSWHASLLRRSA
ncbi:MAG TPA: hypothetical protein VF381_00175 [Thermoanaerobaculia bacterium]